ncbi:hypothetical protein HDV57DRAFT_300194 [Trichoderma longibrachiatum]
MSAWAMQSCPAAGAMLLWCLFAYVRPGVLCHGLPRCSTRKPFHGVFLSSGNKDLTVRRSRTLLRPVTTLRDMWPIQSAFRRAACSPFAWETRRLAIEP